MLRRVFRSPLHMGSDSRRRGVENVGLVALDDLPPAILVRMIRRALIDDAGGSICERAEDDIAVPRDPSDIGRAPEDRVRLDVKYVMVRGGHADEVAGGGVNDAFGAGSSSARVEQVEQIF